MAGVQGARMIGPLRIRTSRRVSAAVNWAVRRTRGRLHDYLAGDYWSPRIGHWMGATVCRVLGHYWDGPIASQEPLPVMLICNGCTDLWTSDDVDAFEGHPRDARDALRAVRNVTLPADPSGQLRAIHDADVLRRRTVTALHFALHADHITDEELGWMEAVLAEARGHRGCHCRSREDAR